MQYTSMTSDSQICSFVSFENKFIFTVNGTEAIDSPKFWVYIYMYVFLGEENLFVQQQNKTRTITVNLCLYNER